jgi:hypothetical protein
MVLLPNIHMTWTPIIISTASPRARSITNTR